MPFPEFNATDTVYGHQPQVEQTYSRLPYILAYQELQAWKAKPLVRKLLGKDKWQPNEGATVKRTEYFSNAPTKLQLRQPNKMFQANPKVDVIGTRRHYNEATPVWQEFHSAEFDWQPSFVEKFPDTVKRSFQAMTDAIATYDEQFFLGEIFHQTPRVYVAGQGWLSTVPRDSSTADVKTADWIKANVVGKASEASILDFMQIYSEMHDNDKIPNFSGSDFNEGAPTAGGTFAMLCSTEFMLNMTFDSYLKERRMLNTDLVGDVWSKAPFGLYTWRNWVMPLRWRNDGTMAAPEITEGDDNAFNKGETVANPAYKRMDADGSPWEAIIIMGKGVGEAGQVGPPPEAFTGSSPSGTILTMDWNSKIRLNQNFLVDTVVDDTGTIAKAINPGGRKARYEATWSGLYTPRQRRAACIYFYKRKLGTTVNA